MASTTAPTTILSVPEDLEREMSHSGAGGCAGDAALLVALLVPGDSEVRVRHLEALAH